MAAQDRLRRPELPRAHRRDRREDAAVPDLFNKYNTALNRHNGTVAVSKLRRPSSTTSPSS